MAVLRKIDNIPFRKIGAFITLVFSLLLIGYCTVTGKDLPEHTADALTYLVSVTFVIYSLSSSYEHVKGKQTGAEIFTKLNKDASTEDFLKHIIMANEPSETPTNHQTFSDAKKVSAALDNFVSKEL